VFFQQIDIVSEVPMYNVLH